MASNIIKRLKRYYDHFRLRRELKFCGFDYHLFKLNTAGHRSFVWSESLGCYEWRPKITNPFLFHVMICKYDSAIEKIFIRKIQIILAEKNVIIKQLKSDAPRIGLLAEKRQRVKLHCRGSILAPTLYEVDLNQGFLKEENILGKPLYEYIEYKEELPEIGFVIYRQLFNLGYIEYVSLDRQYLVYQKKLLSMAKRINNNKLKNFLDDMLEQIRSGLKFGPECSSVMFTDLVHADFNPRNNLIVNHVGDIKVIDWEHSSSGPVLFDYFYFLQQLDLTGVRWSEVLHEKSKLILGNEQCLSNHVRVCFVHLVVIKLNLWEHKDKLNERSLTRRLDMLCKTHKAIIENF